MCLTCVSYVSDMSRTSICVLCVTDEEIAGGLNSHQHTHALKRAALKRQQERDALEEAGGERSWLSQALEPAEPLVHTCWRHTE